jgi:phage shock protein A
MRPSFLTTVALALVLSPVVANVASAQVMPKAQVANLIVKVENGVDEFRNYLEKRGDNAKDAKDAGNTAQASGRRSRQGASENQKAKATAKKDKLDDALGDLNKSTNRLRRKFDATDKWMETKGEVQRVVDDGRAINAEVARGSYGTDVARLWAALRTGINDLARAYNVPPLGV